ncbi:MAG: ion channel DMI1 [Halopseudomonas sp.]|uniref:CASTOR/POLLUX-related putative ion channel n=1 Tax=Halopseudomonas sp. TaxID=2901191 RepID=UPI0030037C8C
MLPFSFVDRLRYLIERQFVKGAHYQLLVVAAFIALISLVGGWLAWPTAPAGGSLADSVWWAFLRLTDPGYLGDDEGTWRRIVSTVLTVSGYVVFLGALVAIMTRWLIAMMVKLEQGLTPVTVRDHIVILGWTNRTIPLIQEILDTSGGIQRLLRARATKRLRLVILADEINAERVEELREVPLIRRAMGNIILRSGTALQPEDLDRVACLQAAVVLIPGRNQTGNSLLTGDVETIKALLTLQAQAHLRGTPAPYVVAEIDDMRKLNVMRRAYSGPLEVLASDAMVSRLFAQSLIHPGMPELFGEVMTVHDGNEFYIRSTDNSVGQTLGEVGRQAPQAILCGLMRPLGDSWRTWLNAPTDEVIRQGDKIVMLARDYSHAEPQSNTEQPLRLLQRPIRQVKPVAGGLRRLLILGWNRRVPALIHELAGYADYRFEVDLVAVVEPSQRVAEINAYSEQTARVSCQHTQADYMVEGALRDLLTQRFDSVLLLSSDRMESGEEADARSMVGYLVIDELLRERSHRPQILLELSDPANESLVVRKRGESIVSPMILSHLMAQIAQRRELGLMFEELFTTGGAEILFRQISDYSMQSVTTFADLEAVVALQGETALGVYRSKPDEEGRRLHLNPPRDEPLRLKADDQLVVLTTLPEV